MSCKDEKAENWPPLCASKPYFLVLPIESLLVNIMQCIVARINVKPETADAYEAIFAKQAALVQANAYVDYETAKFKTPLIAATES